jgi:hypothetical protein
MDLMLTAKYHEHLVWSILRAITVKRSVYVYTNMTLTGPFTKTGRQHVRNNWEHLN